MNPENRASIQSPLQFNMAKQKPDDAAGLNIGRSANSAAAWLNQQKEKRGVEVPSVPVTAIPTTETQLAPVVADEEPNTEKPHLEAATTQAPSTAKDTSRTARKNSPQPATTKIKESDEEAYWEQFLNARSFERPTKNLLITERVHGMISMIARVASAEHKRRMNLNEVLEVIVLSHVEENKPVLTKIQEKWKNRQEWL